MTRLFATLLTVLTILTFGMFDAAAHAADPPRPAIGDRVEITLLSDTALNVAAGWVDSTNRPRTQQDPVLSSFNDTSRLWSSTLTYTARAALVDLTVYLQTGGTVAGCSVAVNGTVTARDTVRRRRGIAVCG